MSRLTNLLTDDLEFDFGHKLDDSGSISSGLSSSLEAKPFSLPELKLPELDIDIDAGIDTGIKTGTDVDVDAGADLTEHKEKVDKIVKDTKDVVDDAVEDYVEPVAETIQEGVGAVTETIEEGATAVGETLAKGAKPVIDTAEGIIDWVGDQTKGLDDLLNNVGVGDEYTKWIDDALSNVSDVVGDNTQGIGIRKGDGSGYGEISLGDGSSGLVVDISEKVDDLTNNVLKGTDLEGVKGSDLWSLIDDPESFAKNLAEDTVTKAISDKMGFDPSNFATPEGAAKQAIKSVVENVGNTIFPGLGNVLSFVTDFIDINVEDKGGERDTLRKAQRKAEFRAHDDVKNWLSSQSKETQDKFKDPKLFTKLVNKHLYDIDVMYQEEIAKADKSKHYERRIAESTAKREERFKDLGDYQYAFHYEPDKWMDNRQKAGEAYYAQ